MLFLYKTSNRAFAKLANATLDREGIENRVAELGTPLTGYGTLNHSGDYHLHVLHDEDFARAKQLLLRLGADDPKPVPLPGKRLTRGAILVILLMVVAWLLLAGR